MSTFSSPQNRNRVPRGVPTGGQFATGRRGESTASTLAPAAAQPIDAPKGMRPLDGGAEAGYDWAITPGPGGTVNGYVRLPEDHPWRGEDTYDLSALDGMPVEVTYARKGWIGFDSQPTEAEGVEQARRLAHAVREAHVHGGFGVPGIGEGDEPSLAPDLAPAVDRVPGPIVPGTIREGVAGHEDPRVQAGEFFDTVMVDGDAFHRRRPGVYPGTPYYTRVQADRPLTADEVERMSQLLGYEYARSVRGERLGSPTQDTPCSFILHTDVTKSARDNGGVALDEFEANLPTIMREGSPVRKTNGAGAGTKGTRLVDPLPDPPAFHLYYDDVID